MLTELYELDENNEPIDGEPLNFLYGDPIDIEFLIEDIDLLGRTFEAQIRRSGSADSPVLAEFEVTKEMAGNDTLIRLHMDGDSAPGALDSPTRKLSRTCRCDVQPWSADGSEPTFAGFDIKMIGDVSR